MCCYFDDIIKIGDFDFNILLDKKLYENICGSATNDVFYDRIRYLVKVITVKNF